eukprot:COSAG03_NODE_4537_length_1517_cov_7.859661_2_plen_210_part_00
MHACRQAGRQAVVSYRRRPRRRAGATARGRTAASVATTIQSPGQTFQHTRPAAAVAPGRQGRSPTSGGAALPRSTAGDASRCAADRGSASAASSTAPLAVAVRPSPTCTLRHAVAVGTAGWQGTARAVRGRPARAEAERGGATPDRDDTSSPACAVCGVHLDVRLCGTGGSETIPSSNSQFRDSTAVSCCLLAAHSPTPDSACPPLSRL